MLKTLHKVSPRLQRMHLKLQKYDLEVYYRVGKQLYVADRSHANLNVPSTDDDEDDKQMLMLHQFIATG